MRRILQAAALVVAAGVQSAVPAQASAAATPVLLAVNRCNSQTIDDASQQIRDFDRHGPGGGTAHLLARYGAIADVIAVLNEERDIIKSLCATDAQRAALFAQIAANAAWALSLEADIAAKLNASCPAAAQALPTMMLSDAWLSLANIINEQNGTVPAAFSDVIPKVRSRAQAVALPLPSWADTSAYWRDQVHEKAKAAVATCPSPSPAASPSPTPSP
jgi:hypothetical protein